MLTLVLAKQAFGALERVSMAPNACTPAVATFHFNSKNCRKRSW